jgi:hypothetical protein
MAQKVKFRCRTCGDRFEQVILDEREIEEAQRKRQPVVPTHCPRCQSQNVQRL